MRLRSGTTLLALALLASLPAAAAKINIDYDQDFDRGKVKTFQWKETDETSLRTADPLLHSYLVNAIEFHLTERGLREVDADPDVYVTYHTSTKEEVRLDTTTYGYGYGGGWRRWGYVGAPMGTTTVTSYERGTLVIDIWDARTNLIVWRGSATDILPETSTKMKKAIDKWLKKMIYTWDKLRARDEKKK